MKPLINIIKKEVRELMTPGSLLSILIVVVMLCSLGTIMGGEIEHASKLSPIGVVNNDSGVYADDAMTYIRDSFINSGVKPAEIDDYVVVLDCGSSGEAITKAMAEKGLKTAISIPSGFSASIAGGTPGKIAKYYIYANAGMMSAAASSINDAILENVNAKTSLKLLDGKVSGLTPEFLRSPVSFNKSYTEINGNVYEGVSPYQIAQATMSQNMMVPIIMMIIIMMVGSIVISSMGNEKENKTLETLLTLPVKRTAIVSGKLIAAALVGLVYGMAYMVGMSVYLGGMAVSGTGGIVLADYGLGLKMMDWVLIAASVFLAILCALGICMILGAFVKNFKAAQTMTLPISILAMIPMFVTMFSGWDALPTFLQAILFAIPFSHPMMAANNLMFGNVALVLGGIAYMALFSLVMIAITVRIYKSDLLLTGFGSTRLGAKLAKMGKKKNAN